MAASDHPNFAALHVVPTEVAGLPGGREVTKLLADLEARYVVRVRLSCSAQSPREGCRGVVATAILSWRELKGKSR
jgi:hypothetical protein